MKKIQLTLFLLVATVVAYAQNTAANGKPEEEPPSIFNALTVTTALIAIAAIILSVMMYRNLARLLNSSGRRKVDIKILQEEMAEIKSRMVQMIEIGGDQNPTAIVDMLSHLDKRIAKLEGPGNGPATAHGRPVYNAASTKRYAQHPDMLNGFSDDVITDQQNGEQIYELDIAGEKASLSISQDPKVQKFAMTDFQYYLAKGCAVTNEPMKGAQILMTEPGILTKTSYGWEIEKKPVISFK